MTADQESRFEQHRRPTRRDEFLDAMNRIVPWAALCAVIEPHYPKRGNGRPPIGLERMLRLHFIQHWFNLADFACEEALYDIGSLRRFVGIDLGREAVRANPLIAQLLVTAIFGYMLMGPMQVILPKLARTTLGLGELGRGAFLGTLAPALIAGGIIAMLIVKRLPHGKTIFIASASSGLLFALMGNVGTPLVAVALLACVGMLGGIAISLIVTGIQENVEESVRGRVLSMYTIISQVMPAVSGMSAGVLTHITGAQHAVMICGSALVIFALFNLCWMRRLRHYQGQ